ncbi:MAG TPA: NAD(P)-dependent oxidoreductase [Rhizomicrobium sp.]|nr:NAD(P)-dependent oxidoreductase [Rhizomicrobium sp.]
MKTVAITGATGFIGRRIVGAALKAGWAVRALSRDPARVVPQANVIAVRWDMDGPISHEFLVGADAICHGAAFRPDYLGDEKSAARCMEANAEGTLRLLRAATDANVPRFVYLSAGNAYAQGTGPFAETAQLFPDGRASYYLTSKLVGEIYVSHWDREGRISGCSLRISSVYGPGMDRRGLIPAMAAKLRAGQTVRLKNGGGFGGDMVCVDDVADAAVAALSSQHRGALNIGSGHYTTAREIAQLLAGMLQVSPDLVEIAPAGPPEPGFGQLDISRARCELDYQPTPLSKGLVQLLATMDYGV